MIYSDDSMLYSGFQQTYSEGTASNMWSRGGNTQPYVLQITLVKELHLDPHET